jgi:DNA-binding CsgD family transcriptional regulator
MYEAFARDGLSIVPMFRPFLAALAQGCGPSLTRTDLVPDDVWYRSPYYRDYHAPAGSDAMLYCSLPLPGESEQMGAVTLRRALGERDFSPRDRAIVLEAHTAVIAWIGGPLARFDEPSPAALPPRLRQVLRCLLEGDSDKQIAARLSLSRYTVNEYVERIFRHFDVSTRPELLARWVRRGWGGRCRWADPEPGAE